MEKATGFFAVILAACWVSVAASAPDEPTEPEIVVEVTAPREEEPAAGPTRPTQVVSGQSLQSEGASNVAQALEQSTGLDLASYGASSAASLVHLRGASPDQVLVLLDGQRLNTAQGGGVDLARLSSLNIDRIEVSRGPASSRFGSDALGGVINIITKSGESTPKGSFSAESGSFGSGRASFSVSSRFAKTDSLISFDRSYSEGDFPFTGPDGTLLQRQNAQVSSHSLFSSFSRYPSASKRLSLTLQDDYSLAGSPGPVQFPSLNAEQEDRRRLVSLSYDDLGRARRLRANLYHQQADRRYADPDAFPAPIDSDHRNQTTSADLSGQWPVTSGQYTLGSSWRRDSLDSSNVGHRYADNAAIFANAELSLGTLVFAPEWRKDWQSQFGSSESPALGLILKLSTLNSLTLNFSKAFRAPSFNDLYWPEDNFAVGNPNLRPERAFGVDVTWKAPNHSFSLFRTRADDLILWQPMQGGKWSPSNVGKAVMEGVELEATGRRGRCEYVLNYTFLHAYDATDDPVTSGKQLIGRPKHQAHLRLARPLGSWEASLQLDATSKRYYTSANTKSIGGNLVADFSLSREIRWLGTLSFSVRNLLDKTYETVSGYPMPGREVRVRLSKPFY